MRMDEMARADGSVSPTERTELPGEFGEAMDGEATRAAARMRWRLVGIFMGVPRAGSWLLSQERPERRPVPRDGG